MELIDATARLIIALSFGLIVAGVVIGYVRWRIWRG